MPQKKTYKIALLKCLYYGILNLEGKIMEKVKTKSRIMTALFATLVLVFALILSACGGEPIERQKALDAINAAISTEVVESVGDYEVSMTMTMKQKQDAMTTTMKQTATLRYDADNSVAYQTMKADVLMKSTGATKIDSTTKASTEYYVGNIEGSTYQVNEKNKAYAQSSTSIAYLAYESTIITVSAPTQDELEVEGDGVKMNLTQNGEGSYDLRFEFTIVTQQATETQKEEKTVTVKEYKIRDNKISEYTASDTKYVDGELESLQELHFEFKYKDVELQMPVTTLTELEGYTEQDFDINL